MSLYRIASSDSDLEPRIACIPPLATVWHPGRNSLRTRLSYICTSLTHELKKTVSATLEQRQENSPERININPYSRLLTSDLKVANHDPSSIIEHHVTCDFDDKVSRRWRTSLPVTFRLQKHTGLRKKLSFNVWKLAGELKVSAWK
ncbi:hypothetical protein Bbelb_340200 [Branchiostoma belcheri]|nr:hypothetical protein Bbelb_340200 [Branchiostoma belcheri]